MTKKQGGPDMVTNMNSMPQASFACEFPSSDPARPYVYPGTSVLINKFGIRNSTVLGRVAVAFSVIRMEMYRLHPLPGNFDLEHLCAIHRYLFQDVFPWAGELRIVSMEKNSKLYEVENIFERSQKVYAQLREEKHLQGLKQEDFIERVTSYYARVNRIHVFREGNNRTQRLFFQQLAFRAGYCLDFPTTARSALWEACQASHDGDLALLKALFQKITSRSA